ncbi:MAG: Peptidase M30 hyicolysin [Spirochaetes bacterium]|nr:MAG: Peptidase M30 hyicolysin [Spirochaetota bacterium]
MMRKCSLGLLSIFALAVLSSCPSPNTQSILGVGGEVFDLSATSVLHLDFKTYEALDVTLANPPQGILYLGKSNLSSQAAPSADTGSAVIRETASLETGFLMDKPWRSDLLKSLPQESKSISAKSAAVPFGDPNPLYTLDETEKNFWIEVKDEWKLITAKLRYVSHTAYIWIPESYYNPNTLSILNNDNLLTKSQIDDLGNRFSGTDPWTGTGIRALLANLYDVEWGGEPGGNGGIDGDQHINILLYDLEEDYQISQTGGLLGYFWPYDEYSSATALIRGVRSNEAEMFYLDVHFADRFPAIMRSTLAHEYQHMIHWNKKKSHGQIWFDEMLSMIGEEFVESYIEVPQQESVRSTRLSQFKTSYHESGITDWLADAPLKSYASAFAFGAYLSRNFGGVELLKFLGESSESGITAINQGLAAVGVSKDFDAISRDYTSAFVLKNPPPSGGYSFPALRQSLGGVEYSVPAFSLPEIGSSDLKIFPAPEQVSLRPYGQSIHTREAWNNPFHGQTLRITRPESEDVSLSLIFSRP